MQLASGFTPPHPKRSRPDIVARAFLGTIESDVLVAAGMGGIHGVLAYLNARTRYRFTGVYPAARGTGGAASRHAYLFDRETPAVGATDLRELQRVCAGIDQLSDHAPPSGGPTNCYPASSCLRAPLFGADGTSWGMICHFDHRLRTMPPSETELLNFLGTRAGRWLEA